MSEEEENRVFEHHEKNLASRFLIILNSDIHEEDCFKLMNLVQAAKSSVC